MKNAGSRRVAGILLLCLISDITARADDTVRLASLQLGATGQSVEVLQRTLNARLHPAPQLSIDGDFGPATRAAVRKFQASKKLPTTGIVDRATWVSLAPLITADPPVPAPDVVNRQKLARREADPVEGVPFVTCKAWAIADGKTGKVLWGHKQNEKRHFASTTKIMTAYVVLHLAQKEPHVLGEQVVFSKRADDTPGSSARIKVGEKLSVKELLFGLMLPSGNDASIALAEHFGSRFTKQKRATDDPLDLFVDEMNRTAKRLGMDDTNYANPHGLTAKNHLSSPRDLLTLGTRCFSPRDVSPIRPDTATWKRTDRRRGSQTQCRMEEHESATSHQRLRRSQDRNDLCGRCLPGPQAVVARGDI